MIQHLDKLESIYNLPSAHKDMPVTDRLIAVIVKQQAQLDRLGERLDRVSDTFPGLQR